jgi:hypothetical protein
MDNKMVKHLLIMLVMPSNEHVKVKLNDAPNIMGWFHFIMLKSRETNSTILKNQFMFDKHILVFIIKSEKSSVKIYPIR